MGGNTSREIDPAKRERWERKLTEIRTNTFPDTHLNLEVRD